MRIFKAFTSFAALFSKQQCKPFGPIDSSVSIYVSDPPVNGTIEYNLYQIPSIKTVHVGDVVQFGYAGESILGDGLQHSSGVSVQWPNGTMREHGGWFTDLCSCKHSQSLAEGEKEALYGSYGLYGLHVAEPGEYKLIVNFTLLVAEDEEERSKECPKGPFIAETFSFEKTMKVAEK